MSSQYQQYLLVESRVSDFDVKMSKMVEVSEKKMEMTRVATEDCPICLDPIKMGLSTSCGHKFCGDCILEVWRREMWRRWDWCRAGAAGYTFYRYYSGGHHQYYHLCDVEVGELLSHLILAGSLGPLSLGGGARLASHYRGRGVSEDIHKKDCIMLAFLTSLFALPGPGGCCRLVWLAEGDARVAELGCHRGEGLGHTRALGRHRGGQGGLGARGGGGLGSGSWQVHHLGDRLLGGTGPGPGPGGRQLLLRLELRGLLHGDALGLALGRGGVGCLGHGGQGRAGAGTGCAKKFQ